MKSCYGTTKGYGTLVFVVQDNKSWVKYAIEILRWKYAQSKTNDNWTANDYSCMIAYCSPPLLLALVWKKQLIIWQAQLRAEADRVFK